MKTDCPETRSKNQLSVGNGKARKKGREKELEKEAREQEVSVQALKTDQVRPFLPQHFLLSPSNEICKGGPEKQRSQGRKMLGKEQTLFHFSRAVLSLGSVDIAGLSVPLPREKPCIYKGDKGQTRGREKDLNWRRPGFQTTPMGSTSFVNNILGFTMKSILPKFTLRLET